MLYIRVRARRKMIRVSITFTIFNVKKSSELRLNCYSGKFEINPLKEAARVMREPRIKSRLIKKLITE